MTDPALLQLVMQSSRRQFLCTLFSCACVIAFSLMLPTTLLADDFKPEDIEFFEKRVRPLLIDQCIGCHGSEKSESDFRVDSRAAILKGGASGDPGAIPGDAKGSLIISSVRHESDFDMPPNGKLAGEQIAVLTDWVQLGLPWPKTPETSNSNPSFTANSRDKIAIHRENHWAFQPIQKPKDGTVDRLLLAKLRKHGLNFSPAADRRTLIRRATFDLTGLPPSYEQVEFFANDDRPDAYPRLIDRLLDSPEYGERWARHWLDVARYADTCGYDFDNVDRSYPFAYTYRDYVIESLNDDLPYDQFIREQLAADQLGRAKNDRSLAALGFITVGRRYTTRHDTIDDQVDVVTRGLMGLTVACARCHDHKYDAIPTEDYYSLFSVFSNCKQPEELPQIGEIQETKESKAYFEKLEELKLEVQKFKDQQRDKITTQTLTYIYDIVYLTTLPDQAESLRENGVLNLNHGEVRDALNAGFRAHWAYLTKDKSYPFHGLANTIALDTSNEKKFEAATEIGRQLTAIIKTWTDAGAPPEALSVFEGVDREKAKMLFGQGSPIHPSKNLTVRYNVKEEKQLRKHESAVQAHRKQTPPGVDHAMVIVDKENLQNARVMIRGNPNRPGALVPRQFVSVLSDGPPSPFKKGTGRLELAEQIASPTNPLTARVIVNRVWMHHFNRPLVDTPSDFGIRCEEPIQQDLLDFLAADFIENGWSLKHLHRRMMLSKAYQQSSQTDLNETGLKADTANRLYWRMNRRRLEIEPLRDSILHVAGTLDRRRGGRGKPQFTTPFDRRRTIYGHLDRQKLPGELRVFDIASPDQSSSKRLRTTVPQQGLFLMNSEFVIEQAKELAAKVANRETKEQVSLLFQRALSRDPSPAEEKIALEFLNPVAANGVLKQPEKVHELTRLEQLSQMMLMTNEFEIID